MSLSAAWQAVLGQCAPSPRAGANARHRLKHATTHLLPAGPPEAHAVFFLPQGPADMRQWWSASRRTTADDSNSPKVYCHCIDKAGYIYSARCKFYEFFFSCCDSVAALALANCKGHVAKIYISRPHPPHSACFVRCPELEKPKW
jgi:hypothetical protein